MLVTDGEHLPFVLLVMPDGTGAIHALHVPDRQALYVTIRQIAHEVERLGAVGVMHISEGWMALATELQPGQRVGELTNRREVLSLSAATADGRLKGYLVEFWKDESGKVLLGEETVFDDKVWWGGLEPIRQVWRGWHKAETRATDQSQEEENTEKAPPPCSS